MKQTTLLIALLSIAIFACDATSKISSAKLGDISVFLQAGTGVSQAIQGVIKYIDDLKNDNIQEQSAADEKNESDQRQCQESTNALQSIIDSTSENINDLNEHINYVEAGINDLNRSIEYNIEQFNQNERKSHELKAGRCSANFVFIMSLKQHREAMSLLDELNVTLTNYFDGSNDDGDDDFESHQSFIQKYNTVMGRLQAYAKIFEGDKELSAFLQEPRPWEDLTDGTVERTDEEIGSGHVDNDVEQLKVEKIPSPEEMGLFKVQVRNRVFDLLSKLRDHLVSSMEYLTNQEITANIDMAQYIADLEREQARIKDLIPELQEQLREKEDELERSEEKLEELEKQLADTEAALKDLTEECERKAADYEEQSQIRSDELSVIEEVERIFNERINTIADDIKRRADQGVEGEDLSANIGTRVVDVAGSLEADD